MKVLRLNPVVPFRYLSMHWCLFGNPAWNCHSGYMWGYLAIAWRICSVYLQSVVLLENAGGALQDSVIKTYELVGRMWQDWNLHTFVFSSGCYTVAIDASAGTESKQPAQNWVERWKCWSQLSMLLVSFCSLFLSEFM